MKIKTYSQLIGRTFNQKVRMDILTKSIKGFTLMEQILVLALTTILVLIGFTAVLNMNRMMDKVRKNASGDRNLYLLQQAMDQDVRNAESVSWDGILQCEKTNELISYAFEDSLLLRISEATTDTFSFVTSDLEITAVKDNPHLVEYITFNLSAQHQAYKMSFFKEYPDFKIMEGK